MKPAIAIVGVVLLAACGGAPEEAADMESVEGAYEEAAADADMSAEEAAVAQLNDFCPENWCMGDYDYEFGDIACGATSCTLSFTAERDGGSTQGSVVFDYDIPLVDEFGDLDAGYFERVTDALDEWESEQAG